jgi:hypothetical protein
MGSLRELANWQNALYHKVNSRAREFGNEREVIAARHAFAAGYHLWQVGGASRRENGSTPDTSP